jgi:hypothetical protein
VLGFTFPVYAILLLNYLIWLPVKAFVEGKPELLLSEDPTEHRWLLVRCRSTILQIDQSQLTLWSLAFRIAALPSLKCEGTHCL